MTSIYHNEVSNASYLSLQSNPSYISQASDNDSEHYTVVVEGKVKKFICNFSGCQKTFRFKSEIERHLSAHSGLRPHNCKYPGCKKSFKRVDALDDHIRSQHTGEAPLMCPYPDCGQRFSTTAKLRYHSALHEDQKPYKCGVDGCDRGFVTLSQLRQHEKSTLAHRRLGLTPDGKRSAHEDSPSGEYYPGDMQYAESKITEAKKRVKYDVATLNQYENNDYYDAPRNEPVYDSHLTYENIKLNDEPAEKTEYLTNVLGENDALKKRLNYTESMIHVMKGQLDKVMLMLPNKFDHMNLLGYKQEGRLLDSNGLPDGMLPEVDNFFF